MQIGFVSVIDMGEKTSHKETLIFMILEKALFLRGIGWKVGLIM